MAAIRLFAPPACKLSQWIGDRLKSHDPHQVSVLERNQWNQAFLQKALRRILGEQYLGARLRRGLARKMVVGAAGRGNFRESELFQRQRFLPVWQTQQESRKGQSNEVRFGP